MDMEALIPLAAIVFVFGIPIVAILTTHQRKMAEIFANRQQADFAGRLAHELAELRDRVNQQTLMLDRLTSSLSAPAQRAPLSQDLSQGPSLGPASPPPLPADEEPSRLRVDAG